LKDNYATQLWLPFFPISQGIAEVAGLLASLRRPVGFRNNVPRDARRLQAGSQAKLSAQDKRRDRPDRKAIQESVRERPARLGNLLLIDQPKSAT
jgi:hypothetical protein